MDAERRVTMNKTWIVVIKCDFYGNMFNAGKKQYHKPSMTGNGKHTIYF